MAERFFVSAGLAVGITFALAIVWGIYSWIQMPSNVERYTIDNMTFIETKEDDEATDYNDLIFIFEDKDGNNHHFIEDEEYKGIFSKQNNYQVIYSMNNNGYPYDYRLEDVLPANSIKIEKEE
jgi:hypothetical protein